MDWCCGIREVKTLVEGNSPQQVPILLWMQGDEVVGFDLFEGDEDPMGRLAASFEQACLHPMTSEARALEDYESMRHRIHTTSEPLARKLEQQLGFPVEVVVVDDLPQLDMAFEALRQGPSPDPQDALGQIQALDERDRACLLRASAELLAHAPWNVIPADTPIEVRADALKMKAGCLAVTGLSAEQFGFLLFFDRTDFDLFMKLADQPKAYGELPTCLSLSFEAVDAADLGVDSGGAVPLPIVSVLDRGRMRQPSQSERQLVMAACMGLTRFVARRRHALIEHQPWDGHQRIVGRYRIPLTGHDKVDIRVRAPALPA